jgi:hypothetical protein
MSNFLGMDGDKMIVRSGNGTWRRQVRGLGELHGIQRGQIWEIERSRGGKWLPYVVTSISDTASQVHGKGRQHTVYMHNLKTGRAIAKGMMALLGEVGARKVGQMASQTWLLPQHQKSYGRVLLHPRSRKSVPVHGLQEAEPTG